MSNEPNRQRPLERPVGLQPDTTSNAGLMRSVADLAPWSHHRMATELLRAGADEIDSLLQLNEELRGICGLMRVDNEYAHRLAVMLECALLDRKGAWDDGHALLDEYRAANRAAGWEVATNIHGEFATETTLQPNT
ncbi:hypothetical protein [Nitrosomonas halophila]|uniref:Uncharacterized protein n=1 Tax=Nitrosomonas halophila TaxID=44576 RepID=A0A1H3P276_9PROT|nr:hypothetical protein [Nitrosomonas halophila]SDY95216.1 hypothetical protein SAMN05421881_108611 [Nitrosomonas halophila]